MSSSFAPSRALLALSLLLPALAWAGPDLGMTQKQPLNWHAIGMFFAFVLMTLGITYWAAGRSKSASDFYTATLLGLTAMIYGDGVDGYIYMVAFFVGWPIILFLMAERLRNLGKFTFADITAYRLRQGPVRTMAAISSLTVVCFYLVAQMV
ncbi:MAG: cation acetate symporter, partial [Massilia sp.]